MNKMVMGVYDRLFFRLEDAFYLCRGVFVWIATAIVALLVKAILLLDSETLSQFEKVCKVFMLLFAVCAMVYLVYHWSYRFFIVPNLLLMVGGLALKESLFSLSASILLVCVVINLINFFGDINDLQTKTKKKKDKKKEGVKKR